MTSRVILLCLVVSCAAQAKQEMSAADEKLMSGYTLSMDKLHRYATAIAKIDAACRNDPAIKDDSEKAEKGKKNHPVPWPTRIKLVASETQRCGVLTFFARLASGAAQADMSPLAIWFPRPTIHAAPSCTLRTLADGAHSHRQCANGSAQLRLCPVSGGRIRVAFR